jgi:hypothetical protein
MALSKQMIPQQLIRTARTTQTAEFRVGVNMRAKFLALLVLVMAYPGFTWLATHYYPDDPSRMVWDDREAFNRKYIQAIELGVALQQQQVSEVLGGPDITEAIATPQGLFQIVYYRTLRAISDGITTKDECTALLFHNKQLIAIADNAERQYRELEQQAKP